MESILTTLLTSLTAAPNIQVAQTNIKAALRLNRLNLIELTNTIFTSKCNCQKAKRLLATNDLDAEDRLYWQHTLESSELSLALHEELLTELNLAERTLVELDSKYANLCAALSYEDTHKQLEDLLDQKMQSLLPKQLQVKDGN